MPMQFIHSRAPRCLRLPALEPERRRLARFIRQLAVLAAVIDERTRLAVARGFDADDPAQQQQMIAAFVARMGLALEGGEVGMDDRRCGGNAGATMAALPLGDIAGGEGGGDVALDPRAASSPRNRAPARRWRSSRSTAPATP